jgi:hypothetical protein
MPASQPLHQGSSPAFRKQVIDLSTPRSIAPYKKLGCEAGAFGQQVCLIEPAEVRIVFDTPSNFV